MVALSGRLLSKQSIECPKTLFRLLLRQCKSLPAGPREHYQHFVRQVRSPSRFVYFGRRETRASWIPPPTPRALNAPRTWFFIRNLVE
jgi:hypothetical protein